MRDLPSTLAVSLSPLDPFPPKSMTSNISNGCEQQQQQQQSNNHMLVDLLGGGGGGSSSSSTSTSIVSVRCFFIT